MIDYEGIRQTVVQGLRDYLDCPIIRSNQTGKPPKYPYISYTITTPKSENKGTYGVCEDGYDRKQVRQIWSITALSDDNSESVMLACKASEWLDHVGTTYLYDNDVRVQSVGNVVNRDNILTIEYEYRNGFDVFFNVFDVVENPIERSGYIETVNIDGTVIDRPPTLEEQLAQAQRELNEANYIINTQNNALSRINKRLEGGDSDE